MITLSRVRHAATGVVRLRRLLLLLLLQLLLLFVLLHDERCLLLLLLHHRQSAVAMRHEGIERRGLECGPAAAGWMLTVCAEQGSAGVRRGTVVRTTESGTVVSSVSVGIAQCAADEGCGQWGASAPSLPNSKCLSRERRVQNGLAGYLPRATTSRTAHATFTFTTPEPHSQIDTDQRYTLNAIFKP